MALSGLLLISTNTEDIEFAKAVADFANLSFVNASTANEGIEILDKNPDPMVLLVDVSTPELYIALETAIQEILGLFSEKADANQVHFIGNLPLGQMNQLVQSPLFGHFILRNYGDCTEAAEIYGRVVAATLVERAFGLGHFMKAGTKIQTVQLVSSTQKQSTVDAVKNYLTAAKFQNRTAVMISNAVDEIIMNAIFDAPVDEAGRPAYSALSRNTAIKLEGKSQVEVQIAFDGKYVGITAVDHYGSVDKTKLLNHLSKAYTQEEYKVKAAVAGAGIGLARIVQSGGGSFFVASENSSRTEVTLLFKRAASYREFKNQFRFVSTQIYF